MFKLPLALAPLLAPLLATAALGQEVLLDQWSEDFMTQQKVGYSHVRILKESTGYLELREDWWPVEGGVLFESSRITTDGAGRVLSVQKTTSNKLGVSRSSVERRGGELHWRMRHRAQPALSGKIKVEVHDSGIVGFLMARGEHPLGELKLRVLDLPTGTKEKTLTAKRGSGLLHVDSEDLLRLYGPKGVLLQEVRLDFAAERRVATKAQAKDMSRRATSKGEGKAGLVRSGGVTIQSPGKGWAVAGVAPGLGKDGTPNRRGMLIHPYHVLLVAQIIQLPIPAARAGRAQMVPRMEESLNSSPSDTHYRDGKVTTAWGLPGMVYRTEGEFRGVEVEGQAWLLRYTAKESVLVVLFAPSDRIEATRGLVLSARKALSLRSPVQLKPTTFQGGLTVKIPADWTQRQTRGRPSYTSPSGSYLTSWLQKSRGETTQTFLRGWAANTAKKLKASAGKIRPIEIDGRQMLTVKMRAVKNGVPMNLSLIAGQAEQGHHVLIVAVETSLDEKGLVGQILSQATWKKN
ncbi:MAG: hypothetical protein JKY65_08255 [Planctomycetes bacterium]|nr:hypothetical protein [Planctomycetota bacterium]